MSDCLCSSKYLQSQTGYINWCNFFSKYLLNRLNQYLANNQNDNLAHTYGHFTETLTSDSVKIMWKYFFLNYTFLSIKAVYYLFLPYSTLRYLLHARRAFVWSHFNKRKYGKGSIILLKHLAHQITEWYALKQRNNPIQTRVIDLGIIIVY